MCAHPNVNKQYVIDYKYYVSWYKLFLYLLVKTDIFVCIAFNVDFCQRLQQNAAGILQYQGATLGVNAKYEYMAWQIDFDIYILNWKIVTLKKNAGNRSGQKAKMPATKTTRPQASAV